MFEETGAQIIRFPHLCNQIPRMKMRGKKAVEREREEKNRLWLKIHSCSVRASSCTPVSGKVIIWDISASLRCFIHPSVYFKGLSSGCTCYILPLCLLYNTIQVTAVVRRTETHFLSKFSQRATAFRSFEVPFGAFRKDKARTDGQL